jgi:hypothetical protein
MAKRHDEFLERGGRVYGISVDTPPMNTAVVEKLALPFPILSDPDRREAVTPLGFADEKDPRKISKPGTVIIDPAGEVVFSVTGRDFADRPDEDTLLDALAKLGLAATTQSPPELGESKPGKNAVPLEGLAPYYRGAKFAVLALRGRYRDTGEEFRDDAKRYVQMLERYMDALPAVQERKGN